VIDLDELERNVHLGTAPSEVRTLVRVVRAAQALDRALHPTPASRGEPAGGMGGGLTDYDGPGAIKCKAALHEALKVVK
jgi:hypothetical protein